MGASAIKLLVYYHPNSQTASQIEAFTKQIAEACKKHDLVLILEPLSYSLNENKKLSSDEKRYVVVETAKRLTPLGVDVLKAEFPLDVAETNQRVWSEACAEISATSIAPWILLSAAVDYDVFLQQVVIACKAGASGIAVGRAVWKEAVMMDGEQRMKFLRTTAHQRISCLTSLCHALAKPYTDFYQADAPFDWYRSYDA
jgi:tagatose-1,6-bisphosphate aldolase